MHHILIVCILNRHTMQLEQVYIFVYYDKLVIFKIYLFILTLHVSSAFGHHQRFITFIKLSSLSAIHVLFTMFLKVCQMLKQNIIT
jgi:hypothetical protein